MYATLIFLHSVFRWLVVLSLVYALYRAFTGYRANRDFSATDNAVRHWTATIAHIQLTIGMLLYTQSPIVRYFWKNSGAAARGFDFAFYGLVHIFLMLAGIALLTVGSSMAKRKAGSREKFRTMLIWFSIAFIVIFLAIPWPFSPFANRPYFR